MNGRWLPKEAELADWVRKGAVFAAHCSISHSAPPHAVQSYPHQDVLFKWLPGLSALISNILISFFYRRKKHINWPMPKDGVANKRRTRHWSFHIANFNSNLGFWGQCKGPSLGNLEARTHIHKAILACTCNLPCHKHLCQHCKPEPNVLLWRNPALLCSI